MILYDKPFTEIATVDFSEMTRVHKLDNEPLRDNWSAFRSTELGQLRPL